MPDSPQGRDGEAQAEGEPEGESTAKGGRKRLLIIIAVVAAILFGVAAGGGYVLWTLSDDPGVVTIDLDRETVYFEMPELLTHLKSSDSGTRSDHIKLQIVVEISEDQVSSLEAKQDAIADAVQSYLHGKERKELSGEAGAEQLRAELLLMIDQRIAPAEAKDILFKTFLLD